MHVRVFMYACIYTYKLLHTQTCYLKRGILHSDFCGRITGYMGMSILGNKGISSS